MFGSKRKQQEEADDTARHEAFKSWFDALEKARPSGQDSFTSELLETVGNPYAFLPSRGTERADLLFYTAQAYSREWAARLSRKAILQADPDAHSRCRFWESVNEWL